MPRTYRLAEAEQLIDNMREALVAIRNKADYAKDNPRQQTDKLFDILELARAALAKAGEGAK